MAEGEERSLTDAMPAPNLPKSTGWLKAASLVLALCFFGMPDSSHADTYHATAPIDKGDVAAAREEAIRDILWEAGLQGGALVQSKAALIQDDYLQSTVVQSRFHLKKFQITREEILPDRVRISAIVEKEDAPSGVCDSAFPMRNIRFEWRGIQGRQGGEDLRQGGIAFGQVLSQALQQEMGPYLASAGNAGQEPVYRIAAYLEVSGHALGFIMPEQAIRIQIWGPTGAPLKDMSLPIGSTRLANRESHDLGYANLRKWGLTPEAGHFLDVLKTRLAEEIRCLPAIVRIPETGPDGSFSVMADIPPLANRQAIVFFASTWPVAANGGVDLMLVDGHIQPKSHSGGMLHFPGSRRLPGRKYPSPGGYLVFQ